MIRFPFLPLAFSILTACPAVTAAGPLKIHGIFASDMVLQRDKPIVVWGWAEAGKDPDVCLVDRGKEKAFKEEAEARCDYRRTEEAKRGVEILARIKVLGQTKK